MADPKMLSEFRDHWLPHVTDEGLNRLMTLLSSASPMLLHGRFTGTPATGCLASHIAWNHPATCDLNEYAGVTWLTRLAGLNPATSAVILAWDDAAGHDWALRHALLQSCEEERARRAQSALTEASSAKETPRADLALT